MKYLTDLVLSALFFGLAVLVFGIELVPSYGSQLVTLLMSALVSSLVGLAFIRVAVLLAAIPSILVGFVGVLIDENLGEGCIKFTMVFLSLILTIFGNTYLMTSPVPQYIDWFPQFTYLEYLTMSLIVFAVRKITNKE